MTTNVTAMHKHIKPKQEVRRFKTWKAAYLIQRNWIFSITALTIVIAGFMWAYFPDLSGLTIETFTHHTMDNFQTPQKMLTAMNRRNLISNFFLDYIPLFYATFFGATLSSRGRETGAYKYTWTQAIGRQRITFAQVIIVLVPVALSAFTLATVFQVVWNTDLIRAGSNMELPGYFPTSNWSYDGFTLQPPVFTAITVAVFLLGVAIGTLSKRMLVAMGLTFIFTFAGLVALSSGLEKSYQLAAHQVVTNDPYAQLPETQTLLVKVGIRTNSPQVAAESYGLGSGFLDKDGSYIKNDQYLLDPFNKTTGVNGETTIYEGGEYRAIARSMPYKFAVSYLPKDAYPLFVGVYAGAFSTIALLLLWLSQLLLRSSRKSL